MLILTAMMLMAAQAATAAPKPGAIKSFGAWAVACDNVHRCEMTSLWPEDSQPEEGSPYATLSVSVVREAGPTGGWTVEIELPPKSGNGLLRVTTEQGLDVRGVVRDDLLRFTGADAAKIVAGMASGTDLRVGDARSVLGMVSLKGSSASLRYIDADQGRAGTITAAVAKGAKPATAVPAPPPLPQIAFVRPSGVAAPFPAALRKALDKASECGSVYEGGEGDLPKADVHPLGGGKTLVLLPCGSGAYNFSSRPYILASGAKPVVAAFDSPPGMAPEGPPDLVNAGFDAKTGRLDSFAKGRGIGDCGSSESYVWDGAMFRLVEQRVMSECRGSVNWLAIWRATAVAK